MAVVELAVRAKYLYHTAMASFHWADITADKVIRKSEKDVYVCASGITPSGTVHVGNFREIISVALVVQALREKGKKVHFLYSWDDYDVFRKVPLNMPQRDLLETYLRKPIVDVPDTTGTAENYARRNELAVESILPVVGIEPSYKYQANEYRASTYAKDIRRALEAKEELRAILNEFRTTELPDDWMPVSVFSEFTGTDNTQVLSWDGDWGLTYRCLDTDQESTVDLRETSVVKLPWRIDWPMRWAYEGVDFEPAGKDHHSEGGSFDTSRKIVRVFGAEAPESFQYDFVRIKEGSGKMSSSSGEVVSLQDLLKIYTPELVRYLFVGTRPNSEFAISFDLDVIKIYEDYDKCERVYYGAQEISAKKVDKEKRIYELSQVHGVPETMPEQISFRHLCTMVQVYEGDVDAVVESFGLVDSEHKRRLAERTTCAWNWVQTFAPEDYRFALKKITAATPLEDELDRALVAGLAKLVVEIRDDKELHNAMYRLAEELGINGGEFFKRAYLALSGSPQGPRLASFLLLCDLKKLEKLFGALLG